MKEYRFKFSVVMAVYKVEEFLREAVESVINQSIGFENIQLILVDDGSPDGSPAICDEYGEKYPDNVVVIHKENGGVSSARNAGLGFADGKLVNFLDSDDCITKDTFKNVWNFYQDNEYTTDIIAIPMCFFDGRADEHTLNYKFSKGNRVIELDREWDVCQLSASSAFINIGCIGNARFDERLAYAEDANFIQRLLIYKRTLGVVQDAKYLYRRRTSGTESAIQASYSKPAWYIDTLKYFHQETIRFYTDKMGFVPLFIQYVIMYDLQWRLMLNQIPTEALTAAQETEFRELLISLIASIDDRVILAQRNMDIEYKIYALRLKRGFPILAETDQDIDIIFGTDVVASLSQFRCRLEFLRIEEDFFTLEGRVTYPAGLKDLMNIGVCVNNVDYACMNMGTDILRKSLGEPVLYSNNFKVTIPIEAGESLLIIKIGVKSGDKKIQLVNLFPGTFFPVTNVRYQYSTAIQNQWEIVLKNNHLKFFRVNKKEEYRAKYEFLKELWLRNNKGERKAVIARILAAILKKLKKKPIWLISDRAVKAGDNGEALFSYMIKNHPEIDSRFVITKNCDDFKRMQKIGPVMEKDSFRHKLYLLISDYICSSQGESDVFNPFIGYSEPYRNLLSNVRFIFLQHGITYNDLSGWLDRYNKNILGFVTSAKPEYDSIIQGAYHYSEEQVWLTGFPRYDRLYHAEEKMVTIMPTWRKYLMGSLDRYTKEWTVGSKFMNSSYLDFYNRLLNDPRLLEAADKLGYKLAFFPHPNLQDHLDCFEKNEKVEFLGFDTEYRDIFAKSMLVVTDYSSAVFDFLYLRKPLIYTQFDQEEFYSGGHTVNKGYLDIEKDGFGEVEHTLEGTVDRIIEYMENGCQLKDKYRRRVENFFAFDDQNNCQRVYDRIMELDTSEQ